MEILDEATIQIHSDVNYLGIPYRIEGVKDILAIEIQKYTGAPTSLWVPDFDNHLQLTDMIPFTATTNIDKLIKDIDKQAQKQQEIVHMFPKNS